MIKRLKRVFVVLLLCTFVVSAYIAWSSISGREPVPIPDALGGGPTHVTGTDSAFDDLAIDRGAHGRFTGTISVENPTDSFQDVIVTVDLFDGDQNVGELRGTVTLKPKTASSVELMSVDPHVPWTDARVDLLRLPS